MDLLNDPGAREVLQLLVKGGDWVALEEAVVKVDVEMVPCTLTRQERGKGGGGVRGDEGPGRCCSCLSRGGTG